VPTVTYRGICHALSPGDIIALSGTILYNEGMGRIMNGKKRQHTLYVIGGVARTGKTTVLQKLMRRRGAVIVQTDGIRAAIRRALFGHAYLAVEKMRINVQATFHKPGSLKKYTIDRTQVPKGEDALAWEGVLGLIESYDRKNAADVIVEGVAATPERVHKLKLKNLRLCAVFIGYENVSHFQSVLAYANKKKDWVYTSIKEHGGDTAHIFQGVKDGIVKSRRIRKSAQRFGYGYFDVSTRRFREHVAEVLAYCAGSR
jgi:hypothetical protein